MQRKMHQLLRPALVLNAQTMQGELTQAPVQIQESLINNVNPPSMRGAHPLGGLHPTTII
jgi:hypothetical protein